MVVGEGEVWGGRRFRHMTTQAVFIAAMRLGVAGEAALAVKGWGVALRVFVRGVAGRADQLPLLIAAAHREAERLEADVERIIGRSGWRQAVAGGAEFQLGGGIELGGVGHGAGRLGSVFG